jgi:hypothetical protein
MFQKPAESNLGTFRRKKMNMSSTIKTLSLVAGAGLLTLGSVTKADIIPVLDSHNSVSGGYNWVYTATFSNSSRIEKPTANTARDSFFTIYDFEGFSGNLSDLTAPANWTASASLLGRTPGGVTPPDGDDSTKWNVTFKYVGTTTVIGPQSIPGFGIKSIYGKETLASFTSNSIKQAPGTKSHRTILSNQGQVEAPSAVVPLPAASWMGLTLLAGIAAVRYFRRGQTA